MRVLLYVIEFSICFIFNAENMQLGVFSDCIVLYVLNLTGSLIQWHVPFMNLY